jgi:hypothetical protein
MYFTEGQKRHKGIAGWIYGHLLNHLAGLEEVLYVGDAIVGDIDVINFNHNSFHHFKMVEIQICVVDSLPAPFSIPQQWVGIA